MRRRGQAALEFLTTYGWAVLVILIMIGAISYFGILNPGKLLPSRCTVGTELSCEDYIIDNTGTISLQMKQGIGKTIYLQSLNCSFGTESDFDNSFADETWSPRDTKLFSCTLPSLVEFSGQDQKVKVFFDILYTKSVGGFDHVVSGELYTEVKT